MPSWRLGAGSLPRGLRHSPAHARLTAKWTSPSIARHCAAQACARRGPLWGRLPRYRHRSCAVCGSTGPRKPLVTTIGGSSERGQGDKCLSSHRVAQDELTPRRWWHSSNSTVGCQAGSAQAVQQASGQEKLLALAVPAPWQRESIGSCPVAIRERDWCARHGCKGCCTSDLPSCDGRRVDCNPRTPGSASLPRELLVAAVTTGSVPRRDCSTTQRRRRA